MVRCERCGAERKRRMRCVLCKRLICGQCANGPRMRGEVVWCAASDHLNRRLDKCVEVVTAPRAPGP